MRSIKVQSFNMILLDRQTGQTEKHTERQTGRETERGRERQKGRERKSQSGRQTDRQTASQTNSQKDSQKGRVITLVNQKHIASYKYKIVDCRTKLESTNSILTMTDIWNSTYIHSY